MLSNRNKSASVRHAPFQSNVEEAAVATEEITTVVVEESTIFTKDITLVTEESTQELVPMAANSCPSNYSLYYPDGRIYFDHSHGGMQPHVHIYTWHQGPNGHWNSSTSCVAYDSELYPRP